MTDIQLSEDELLNSLKEDVRYISKIPKALLTKEFVKKAFKVIEPGREILFLHPLPYSIKSDKEMVMMFIEEEPLTLCCVSEDLYDDEEVIKAAVSKSPGLISYASYRLKSNKEIGLIVAKGATRNEVSKLCSALLNDDDIATESLKNNPSSFGFFSHRIRSNRDVVLDVISRKGDLLKYASDELRKDKELALIAYKNDPTCFQNFPIILQAELKDKDVVNYLEKMVLKEKLTNDLQVNATTVKKHKL